MEELKDLRDWPFLARKYQFTIAHSLELYRRSQRVEPARSAEMLAFAPKFSSEYAYREKERIGLGPLENNVDEAAYVSQYYRGKTALGSDATKSLFLENASDYGILHLATHAQSNEDFDLLSFIAFGDEEKDRLYAGHIFGMDVPAELVVLSACETGQGYDLLGEGPMSLSRAFAAAGAKSTVSTLWRVSDRESAQLVGRFYDFLAEGYDKDAALRAAQVDMIQNGSGRSAHPYFWAGYVLQGDPRALPTAGGWDWRLIGSGMALLLGFGYLASRRRRRYAA
jgi:CHAT domain-containing protein